MKNITEQEEALIFLALQDFLHKLRKARNEAHIPGWQRELDKSIKEYEVVIEKMKEVKK